MLLPFSQYVLLEGDQPDLDRDEFEDMMRQTDHHVSDAEKLKLRFYFHQIKARVAHQKVMMTKDEEELKLQHFRLNHHIHLAKSAREAYEKLTRKHLSIPKDLSK